MTLRWAARLLFVVAIVLITDLALQPGTALPPRLFGTDKLEHFAAFMALAILARVACPNLARSITGIVLLVYGGGIEWLQDIGSAGRTASLADFLADAIGVICGLLVAWWAGTRSRH